MKRFSYVLVGLIVSIVLAGCACISTAQTPTKISDGVLTDASGMTLYIFDKDTVNSGKSVCNGPCATNWPPLIVMEGATAQGDYSIVVRDDGKKQWAFKGKPLYLWSKDQKPGDMRGDGFINAWHVVKP